MAFEHLVLAPFYLRLNKLITFPIIEDNLADHDHRAARSVPSKQKSQLYLLIRS